MNFMPSAFTQGACKLGTDAEVVGPVVQPYMTASKASPTAAPDMAFMPCAFHGAASAQHIVGRGAAGKVCGSACAQQVKCATFAIHAAEFIATIFRPDAQNAEQA